MRAAVATDVQDIDKHIHVKDDWPQPTLFTAIDGKTGKLVSQLDDNDNHIIIKVLSCALAPGDVRLFRGKTDMMQLPKSGRPYIIGSDVCGIVVEVDDDESYYKVGDKVIARFDEPQPHGMAAEYTCVKTKFSEKCPQSIPANQACTLPASAAAARLLATKFIKKESRVLILGGSGGLGTFLCQYVKLFGASYLAVTTTQKDLVISLGADRVIDYTTENWWEVKVDEPFDLIIDLVNGSNWQLGACSKNNSVIKGKNTMYAQLLTGVETEIDASSFFGVIRFMSLMLRSLYSKVHSRCPQWTAPQGLDLQPGDLKSVLQDVEDGKIRVILDPAGPFSFDDDGVRNAMRIQHSKHAHGKVVIEIALIRSNEELHTPQYKSRMYMCTKTKFLAEMFTL